jgi:hypothetical protein
MQKGYIKKQFDKRAFFDYFVTIQSTDGNRNLARNYGARHYES